MITATWTQATDDVPHLIDFDKLNTPYAHEAAVALTELAPPVVELQLAALPSRPA